MQYQNSMQDQPIANDGAAAQSRVPRSELLLSGNRIGSLLESLLAWSGRRLGAVAHGLYVMQEDGQPQRVGESGALDARDADALVLHFLQPETTAPPAPADDLLVQALRDGDVLHGVLVSQFQKPWDEVVLAQMEEAAALLAQRLPSALELERLNQALAQLAEAERLQRALYMIADLASGEHAMDDVLAAIHGIIGGLMYAENFFIALYDAQTETVRMPYFRDVMEQDVDLQQAVFPVSDLEGSLTLHALRTGKSMMGPSDQLLRENGLRPGGFGPQSEAWLGVPLLRGSEVVGVLVVQSYDSQRRYSEKDRALLNFVAQHVATALDRLRSHEELERRVRLRTDELNVANTALRSEIHEREQAERLQAALFRIAELGSMGGSLETFFQSLHTVIGELIHAENFYIALLAPDHEHLDFPYSVDERDRVRSTRLLSHGLTEYVLRNGRALLADREMIRALENEGELRTHGTMSTTWLGVPLIYDNHTVGVMAVQSYDDAHTYRQRDQDLLTFVAHHIANALQRKRQADILRETNAALEERVRERTKALASINAALRDQIAERERAERRLRHAALHDALTGLPNRSLLLDRMAQALDRYRRDPAMQFAVLFLDLDRFKVVNDSVGHLVGDELLKAAGGRIRAQLPEHAMIARLGGDEFAVLLESSDAAGEAPEVASHIIAALEEPLRIAGKDIYSSVSIGISLSQPHYRTAEELLRDADVALYRAKANGRRRFEVFDETLRRHVLLQLELEGNLRRALTRREFEPVFQPVFDLESGAVVGFEALLRWRHPQHGLIAPAEFLSQAEESGLSEAIDWQVFDSAFAQAEVLVGSRAYLGINVGARHLRTPQFVDALLHRFDAFGFNPAQLRIEVTERVLLEDPEQSRALMARLASYGISVALDDFGTGYSSLSYLHQFPLQAIKVDRSFISPLDSPTPGNSLTVLRAVHALGTELGLEVIAEGIETPEQLRLIKELGGACGQGFLLARPAPAHSLVAQGWVGS